MVRRCAVKNCNSTDLNIISHRFPRSEKSAAAWRDALGINSIPLQHLISKYVVCTLHFLRTDYRNPQSNFLNSTAIPKKPVEDTETQDKYSLIGMLDDYYEKPVNTYRKERDMISTKTVINSDKTIMVYEINELDDIEALQEAEDTVEVEEEEEQVDDVEQENTVVEDEDDGTVMEYIPQHKKHKFDSDTTYVRLENNVVIALSEQEEDDDEQDDVCFQEPGDETLNFHEDNQTENTSIDLMFLEKDGNDEELIDEELVQLKPELIHVTQNKTNGEQLQTDENIPEQDQKALEVEFDEGDYATYSRKDLIEKLLESGKKIQELESKLETIQSAQADMVKSIENFKKIFSS